MSTLANDVRGLLTRLEGDATSEVRERLRLARMRLDEPLRVAIAGRVKSGKSTLLNAIVGVPIAASDAAECTRFVTWYRHGTHPIANVVDRDGARRQVPFGMDRGIDVSDQDVERIDRLEVEYPSPVLSAMTLIDTPGIASISEDVSTRSTSFLVPQTRDQGADVLVYLLRFLHERDTDFLESFTDTSARYNEPVRSIGVLSRADELAGGRGDGFDLARSAATRLRDRQELRGQVSDVIAVSGLIGLNGSGLRQQHFDAIRSIAELPLHHQDQLLLSVDRFRDQEFPAVERSRRVELIERFGLPGIRFAVAVVRRGDASTGDHLAERLVELSGIVHVRRVLLDRYAPRAEALKAGHALDVVRRLAGNVFRGGSVEREIERIEADSYELVEIRALNDLAALRASERTAGALRPPEWNVVEAALGADGLSLARRAGLGDGDNADPLEAAKARIGELRAIGGVGVLPRRLSLIVQSAVRSLETIRYRTTRGDGES